MFCFPNVGHVMILLRTVSFKFCLIHMDVYVCIIYEKIKRGKFPSAPH